MYCIIQWNHYSPAILNVTNVAVIHLTNTIVFSHDTTRLCFVCYYFCES